MTIDELLKRDGLPPELRLLVSAATAVWRADWQRLSECAAQARELDHPRSHLQETLLMCVLFCGFPRAITAWGKLLEAWPTTEPPSGGALPTSEQASAGGALFASIYGKHEEQVREMLRGYHQELHDFVLEAAYGRILTRPGLSALIRELIAVGVLAAEDQPRQFLGHARGAIQLGATHDQLTEVLVTTFDGDKARVAAWRSRLPV